VCVCVCVCVCVLGWALFHGICVCFGKEAREEQGRRILEREIYHLISSVLLIDDFALLM
jgi:hypothetical protein